MTERARPLALLVVVSMLAGLLVAAIGAQVLAPIGYATKSGVDAWESLPEEFKQPPLPQRTRVLAADGSVIADFYYQDRVVVHLEDVPLVARQAVVAVEDARFYEHNGVDIKGTLRALYVNQENGGVSQGGSTLTQQYVKNVLLLSARTDAERKAAVEDTFIRKAREARYALALEHRMTKDQILEGYLNIAYFGSGAYGIGTAAQHYFGKPVQKLTLPEAALLAGLVKNPYGYDPILHPAAAVKRRNIVLQRMAEVHFITEHQRAVASASKLRLHVRRESNGCESSRFPYFCTWLIGAIESDRAFGATAAARRALLLKGGLTIRTTLDPKVQDAAQNALDTLVPADPKRNPRRIASAVAVVEPGTGNVKALAVNLPYGSDSKKGLNANNLVVGGSLGYQGGSTMKLFTLLTALSQGLPPSYTINAPAYVTDPDLGYSPTHRAGNAADGHETGPFNLVTGTAASVNTFFLELEKKVGVLNVAATATKMGLNLNKFNKNTITAKSGSLTLGGWEVDPLEMAGAYATVAAHGKYCAPRGVLSARAPGGKDIDVADPQCSQVLEQGVADTATTILTHVINGPETHTGSNARLADGRPAAGKTGTTNEYGAAWFDGFTPQLAAAVWVGDPMGPGHLGGLRDLTIDGRFWSRMFGGDLPAMIWKATMDAALAGVPIADFPPPDPRVMAGVQTTVPLVTGLTPAEALSALQAAGFSVTIAPQPVNAVQPAGTVAYTTPAGNARVPLGTPVVIYLSNGIPPTPTASPTPSTSGTPTGSPSASASPTPRPSPTTSGTPGPTGSGGPSGSPGPSPGPTGLP